MCPGKEENCLKCDSIDGQGNTNSQGNAKGASAGHEVKSGQPQVSPLLEVLSQSKGAQSLYSFAASYFIVLIAVKVILIVFSHEERMSCMQFFGGQFGPIRYFIQLFILHHLILYSLVYPSGKYFKHSTFLLKITGLIATVLFKFAIYSLIMDNKDTSATIRMACVCENVRVMMKAVSFLTEVRLLHQRKPDESEVTLSRFTYFLFAPTLIYRSSYRRTNKPINWRAFAYFTAEYVVISLMFGLFTKDLLLPAAEEHKWMVRQKPDQMASYIRVFPYHVTQSVLVFFGIAFGFLHCYSNAMAELLCFADRNFYKDWWAKDNSAEMLRKWNRIVGTWLLEYVYKNLVFYRIPRYPAMAMTMFFSGLYHDYVVGFGTGIWSFGFTIMMTSCTVPVMLAPKLRKWNPLAYEMCESLFGLLTLGVIAMFHFYPRNLINSDQGFERSLEAS